MVLIHQVYFTYFYFYKKLFTGLNSAEEISYSDPKAAEEIASYKAKVPLDESNIGNRMLKSMGWSEGQGLGRNSQGKLLK